MYSTTRTRPTSQPQDTSERRLRVAMRMSQLASSRALIFLVGIVCGLFGAIAWSVERQTLTNRLEAETQLVQLGTPSEVAVTMLSQVSHDEQILYGVIAAFGVWCLVLAKFLYHHPLFVPIAALAGFLVAFACFWKFNHSDSPTLYTSSSLLILGAFIMAIRAGHQFRLSYARMGRNHER